MAQPSGSAGSRARVLVVAVSGCTRSGKSTLTEALKGVLTGKVAGLTLVGSIHQDSYFDRRRAAEKLGGNKECDEALDNDVMIKDVRRAIEAAELAGETPGRPVLLIEGFRLYTVAELVPLIDVFLWIDVDKKTCYDRRMSTKPVSEEYFHTRIWRAHSEYRSTSVRSLFELAGEPSLSLVPRPTLYVVDGTEDPENIVSQCIRFIRLRCGLDSTDLCESPELVRCFAVWKKYDGEFAAPSSGLAAATAV